jgi:RHS repeat-associated protein
MRLAYVGKVCAFFGHSVRQLAALVLLSGGVLTTALAATPVVTMTSPANNATFAAPATFTLSASITTGTWEINPTNFYKNGALVGSVGSGFSPSITISSLPAGTYTFYAVATSRPVMGGGSTNVTSNTITVTVTAPNVAPTASLSAPASNARFVVPSGGSASVGVSGSGSDSDGTVSQMEVLVDGGVAATIGGASVSTNVSLAIGTHTVQLRATDNKGATGLSGTATNIVVAANVAPTANLTAPGSALQYTVASGGTVSVNVAGNGADTDGTVSTMEVLDNGSPIASSGGAGINTNVSLAAGPHSIRVRATDNFGATGMSSAVSVTVNGNIAPSASMSAPSGSPQYVVASGGTVNISVSGSASDSDGSVSKIDVLDNGGVIATVYNTGSISTTVTLAAGSHSIQLRATDNFGSTGSSSATNVVVSNNVAPSATLSTPANGASFSTPAGTPVNVGVVGSGSDSDGSVAKLELVLDGSTVATVYTGSINTSVSLAIGSHTLKLKATDNLGATSFSGTATVTVTAANVPPVVSMTKPSALETRVTGDTIALAASASDSDGSIASVEFHAVAPGGQDTLLSTVTTGSGGTYSYNWTVNTLAAAGNYSLYALARDNQGAATQSASVTQPIVSNGGPGVNFIAASATTSSGGVPTGGTLNAGISYTVDSANTTHDGVNKVELREGTTVLASKTYTVTYDGSQYQFVTSGSRTDTLTANLAVGVHNLYLMVYTAQGGVADSVRYPITVTIVHPIPVATLSTPANGVNFTPAGGVASVPVIGSATDQDGTVTKIEVLVDGALNTTVNAASINTNISLSTGAHTVQLRATDNFGGIGLSATSSITVDAPPTASLTAPVNNASYTTTVGQPVNVTVTGSGNDSDGTISKLEVFLDGASTPVATVNNGSTINQSISVSGGGSHQLYLRATDNLGVTGVSSTISINIAANAPPTATLTSPANNASFNTTAGVPASVSIVGSGSDDGSIKKLELLDTFNGSTTVIATSNTASINTSVSLAIGSHSLQLRATDNLDAIGLGTVINVSVSVPNGLPVVSMTKPSLVETRVFGDTIALAAMATDSDGSIASVEFHAVAPGGQDTLLSTVTAGSGNIYSYNWVASGLTVAGNYGLYALARDNQGGATQSTLVTQPMVSNGGPGVNFIATSVTTANGGVINGGTLSAGIAYTVNSANTTHDGVNKVELREGTSVLATKTYTVTYDGSQYNFVTSGARTDTLTANLGVGVHNLYLMVYTAEGGVADSTRYAINVTVLPTVAITAPTAGATYAAPASITLTASAVSSGGSIDHVEYFRDGASIGQSATPPYSFAWTNVAAGNYTLTAKAFDSFGLSTTSAGVPVTVTTPVLPTVSLVTPGSGTAIALPATLHLSANASQSPGGIKRVDFYSTYPDGSDHLLGSNNTPSGSLYAVDASLTGIPVGTHRVFARAVDLQDVTADSVKATVVVTSGTVPNVTLDVQSKNVRVAVNQSATVVFTGTGTDSDGTITTLDLLMDTGGGYSTTPIKTVTGSSQTLPLSFSYSAGAGIYRFKLRATDNAGNQGYSSDIAVNITSSPLLGMVNGVRTDENAVPLLYGWVCEDNVAQILNYQVYANYPSVLGGILIGSGSAGLTTEVDNLNIQTQCHTPGTGHHFNFDLSSFTAQYPGVPLFVQATSGANTIVLPCGDNNCTMPGSLRIGLTTPVDEDRYTDPATVFMRAQLSNGAGPYDEIAFRIDSGAWIPGTADGAAGAYYASQSGLVARTEPYIVMAKVRQGNSTLYSVENRIYVQSGTGTTLSLDSPSNGATGNVGTAVVLRATPTGNVAGVASVKFYANGKLVGLGVQTGGSWSANWNPSVGGSYSINARAFEASGMPVGQSLVSLITVSGNATGGTSATPIPVSISPTNLNSPDAGSLPGSLGVNNGGAAVYAVPIAVPPGTAGMQPKLALNYSSLAGNGIAGFGWSLSGGSGIHRCIHTVAQDGYAGPIRLDSTDALCLDGQRLVLKTGTYGQIGSTYRTEIDTFSRVTAIAGWSGQIGFQVETKGGQTMFYGTTGDSAARVVGKFDTNRNPVSIGTPLFWALTKVVDRKLNQIVFEYTQDTVTTGEHLLQRIRYGNNTATFNSVDFEYECRNGTNNSNCTGATAAVGDADIVYLSGARVDQRHRLKTIATRTNTLGDGSGGTLAQTTTLTYVTSAVSQRSLVQQMQVCPGVGACLPATIFNWGTPNSSSGNAFVSHGLMNSGPALDWGVPPPPGKGGMAGFGAFGYMDPYAAGLSTDPGGDSPFPVGGGSGPIGNLGFDYQQVVSSLITGDFYGDGKQRILTADKTAGAWHIYTANSAGTDFDRVDLSYANYPGLPTQLNFGVPNMSLPYHSIPPDNTLQGPIHVGDFDGDGSSDIAFLDTNITTSLTSYSSGTDKWVVCLSRMATTGGFDCKSFDLPAAILSYLKSRVQGQAGSPVMPMATRANGRTDALVWWNNGTVDQRCSYVAPTSGNNWSWTCGAYAGLYKAIVDSPAANYPISDGSNGYGVYGSLTNGSKINSTAMRNFVGDFFGSGQTSFTTLRTECQSSPCTNADLFVAVANDVDFLTQPVGAIKTPSYTASASNQFAWSASNVPQVISRFYVRKSRLVEFGGTPLADINGDGYTDYLFTFEGHAEICYSNGIDGFDCRLMEEGTPSNWGASAPYVPTGLTITPDSNGLVGVFSVVTVGHASDKNVTEIIYRRGDGGAYNNGAGGLGGDKYLVCIVRDGMKNCTPWDGPKIRPYASGSETFVGGVLTDNYMLWPVAGTLVGDYTGNGRTEMLWYNNDATQAEGKGWRLYVPNVSGPVDRLISVTNGIGNKASVDYKPMSDASVYTQKPVDGATVVYPLRNIQDGGRMLVSQLHTDNGDNTSLTSSYKYEGLAVDLNGRGEQGFERVTVTNPQGTQHTTKFAQGYPYTGMTLENKVVSSPANGSVVMDLTTYTLDALVGSGGCTTTLYPYTKSSTQLVHKDLNGADLGLTNSSVDQIDCYGYPLQTTSTTLGVAGTDSAGKSYSTIAVNVVDNNTAGWQIGLLRWNAVIKKASGQSDITRVKHFDYDAIGLLQAEAIEPAYDPTISALISQVTSLPSPDVSVRLATSYQRDSFGNIGQTIQSWLDPSTQQQVNRVVQDITYELKGRFPQLVKNATCFVAGGVCQSETRSYDDKSGAPISQLNSNQLTTTWQVDGFGRRSKETRPDQTETRYYIKQCAEDCPPYAVVVSITDSFKGSERIATPSMEFADAVGHVLRKQSWGFAGDEIHIDLSYDQFGRPFEISQPHYLNDSPVLASRYGYDELNRVTSIKSLDENGNYVTTLTSYEGLITTATNAKLNKKLDQRNPLGQLIKTTDALGHDTLFTRDSFGNLVETTDPNGNSITVGLDRLGRKTDLRDPDLGWLHYDLDPRGLVWRQVNPKQRAAGNFSVFQFDVLDRLTVRVESDLESHWVYDQLFGATSCSATFSCGQLIEAYTQNGNNKDYDRVHTFDSLGRPSVTTINLDTVYTNTIQYDSYGRIGSLTNQRGVDIAKVFGNRYNSNGYLARLERGNLVLWQASAQDAANRVNQANLGNGLVVKRNYSPQTGRLMDAHLNIGQSAQVDESYLYDVLGNVSTRAQYWSSAQAGFSEGFDYDSINRLYTTQVSGQPIQVVTYDFTGNISSKTGVGTGNYVYPAQGANSITPHGVTSIPGIGSFYYDVNGNLQSGAGRSLTWTSFNMPLSISGPGVSSQFVYGPEHQRTKQTRGDGSVIRYAGAIEVETNGAGVQTVKTYWPMGLGVEIDKPSTSTSLNWFHTDRLGSVIAISDQTGALLEMMGYDAWGKRRTLGGNATPNSLDGVTDNKGFTGHEMMDQLDLVHMNGRVFDPLTARFISADPFVQDPEFSQSYNRYAYVWNNPTNLTDPTGFDAATLPTVTVSARRIFDDVVHTISFTRDSGNWFFHGDQSNKTNAGPTKSTAELYRKYAADARELSQTPDSNFSWFERAFADPRPGFAAQAAAFERWAAALEGDEKAIAATVFIDFVAPAAGVYAMRRAVSGPGTSPQSSGKSGLTVAAKKAGTFPDKIFTGKRPHQTTPGTSSTTQERYNPATGKLEKSEIKYDQYGRQVERKDFTNHGYGDASKPKEYHSDPHTHTYEYGPGYGPKGKETRINND